MSIINTASQSAFLTALTIYSIIVVAFAQTSNKEKDGMSISSSAYQRAQSIRCSICNSISKDGLTQSDIVRMGAQGAECINNPKKFVQDCEEWRKTQIAHPLNQTVQFTGCYKTIFTYEYDVEGNKAKEDRVVRSCGFLGKPGCMQAPGHGTTQTICFCTGPECNGSSSLKSGFIILASLVISTVLLRL